MVTRRAAIMAIAVAMAFPAGKPAEAARNPLIGTWTAIQGGRDASSALVYYVTFWANGSYQTQIYFGANRRGKGAGMAVILGGYSITGPDTYDYWELRYLICPGATNCGDYPQDDPNFGRRKSSSFRLVGSNQLVSGGLTWTRVS